MNPLDTAKEIVRMASTAGLSKDVIDLLEKKLGILTSVLADAQRKIASLETDNANLRTKLRHLQPVAHNDEQLVVLRVLATKEDYWKPEEVAAKLGSDVVRIHSLLAKLKIEKHVFETMQGFHISSEGRAALL